MHVGINGKRIALSFAVAASTSAAALDRTQIAIVVNTSDPQSVAVADYYAERRRISFQNVIRVSFPARKSELTRAEFDAIKSEVDRKTPPGVQAYALTWAAPYRVECMSITSAFAFGFDPAFCAAGCKPTRPSAYFASNVSLPFRELAIRPTMSIAAASVEQAKALIDRGVASDATFPAGTAYLLSTSDKARNVRSREYPVVEELFGSRLTIRMLNEDAIRNKNDVLFYFTGVVAVQGLSTLHLVPGAIADHLTSSGGMLTDSRQMSSLRWLEAGATGSFGTVVEPCAMPEKFPNPAIVIGHYLAGETLIEAYWKSVAMPGQGIFIGEPLASPYRRTPMQ